MSRNEPRYKIARKVAANTREEFGIELRRRAGDRLSEQQISQLLDHVEGVLLDEVNGALKRAAVEKYDHDLP